jgi:hypothetical protein
MTYKEVIYDIRESIKALNIDSDLTDRQIAFLVRIFRAAVVRQFITNNPGENREMLTQTMFMELEIVSRSRLPQFASLAYTLLATKKVLPNVIGPTMYKNMEIRPIDILGYEVELIPKSRATEIIYAPKNFIYSFRDDDGKLYLIGTDSQYKNMTSINVTAIYENPEEIQNIYGLYTDIDIYPITANLWVNVKQMVLEHILKEMSVPVDVISNKEDEQLSEKTQ